MSEHPVSGDGNGTVSFKIKDLLAELNERLERIEQRLANIERKQDITSAFVTVARWAIPASFVLASGLLYAYR